MTAAYGKHDIDRLQEELADVRADAAGLRAEIEQYRSALEASRAETVRAVDALVAAKAENGRLNALLDTVAGRMEEVCEDLPVDRAADARASVGELLPELGIIRRVMFGKEK